MNWYFIFFVISGFCSVLYELVWLRLAMAQFGVTTAMVSIVLSVFMAGLGLGSWASGRWLDARAEARVDEQKNRRTIPALRLYALTELLIGVSGLFVPYAFVWGRHLLEHYELSSLGYYVVAGVWVGISMIPWCALMGATVPVGMAAIAQSIPAESRRSFSFLYTANVAGAVAGTQLPLFLIELLGFRGTLKVGITCNCLIAVSALIMSRKLQPSPTQSDRVVPAGPTSGGLKIKILTLLFLSGLTCMAMEVVWVRCYTPYFGTVVYAFASILGVYLLGTLIGSTVYRRWSVLHTRENPVIWTVLGTCGLLPLVAASPFIQMDQTARLFLGVAGFTGALGFITPMLVDRFSAGDPGKAGIAYATNVVGCILGPLVAGFGLLPVMSERWALVVLTLPWLVIGLAPFRRTAQSRPATRAAACALFAISALMIVVGRGYEERFPQHIVLRDATATVIATGTGMDKRLLVNGYGITNLTTITKLMAHLPLAFLKRPPQDALVICFGMGTTFRSLHSWGIPVTAVELVPSVPRLFSYYHSDGNTILASPLSHVVIDDGRRYLERTRQQYDVITVDPPPPMQAAGSSLLYSEEFYRAARQRLRPGGILQQWIAATSSNDPVDLAAVARSLRNSFAYVRPFADEFGMHFLASDQPIANRTAHDLLQSMPASAVADLAEWEMRPGDSVEDAAYRRLHRLLAQELSLDQLIAASFKTPALTDDRPVNEYYILREWSRRWHHFATAHLHRSEVALACKLAELKIGRHRDRP